MDKKKIVGIIIFTVALALYVGYPNLVEFREQRLVEAMIEDGMYDEVFERLGNNSYDMDSWQYLALMRIDYHLGRDGVFNTKIEGLIKNDQKAALQVLVNEFGHSLNDYLLAIEQLGGIKFNDPKVRESLALKYMLETEVMDASVMERVRELRGESDVIDIIDVFYYYVMGDIKNLVDIYDEVPENLQVYYYILAYSVMGINVFNAEHEGNSYLDMEQHLNTLDSIEFSDELLRHMGKHIAYLEADSLFTGDSLALLAEPFIQDNIYFKYYQTLIKVASPETKEEGLRELNEREEYGSIKGSHIVLDIVNNGSAISRIIEINNKHMLYKIDGEMYSTNLFEEGTPKLAKHYSQDHLTPSNNRSYYLTMTFAAHNRANYTILDSSFQEVKILENLQQQNIQWVDNDKLYYQDGTGWLHNLESGERTQAVRSEMDFKYIDLEDPDSQLYRINEDTYTVVKESRGTGIEYYWTEPPRHYQVRSLEDHEVVYEMELPLKFMGSCDQYIYGLELIDTLDVLVTIDKETKEKVYLPFYQTIGWSYVNYLENIR